MPSASHQRGFYNPPWPNDRRLSTATTQSKELAAPTRPVVLSFLLVSEPTKHIAWQGCGTCWHLYLPCSPLLTTYVSVKVLPLLRCFHWPSSTKTKPFPSQLFLPFPALLFFITFLPLASYINTLIWLLLVSLEFQLHAYIFCIHCITEA